MMMMIMMMIVMMIMMMIMMMIDDDQPDRVRIRASELRESEDEDFRTSDTLTLSQS